MKQVILVLLFVMNVVHARPTVVAIHGYMASAESLVPIAKTLDCSGFAVYLWNYPSRWDTFRGHGHNLALLLQQIACHNPDEPIHFVSHSIGALVLRAALNDPCCPPQAKAGRIVLIAPPNRGSSFAKQFRDIIPVRWLLGNKSGYEVVTFEEDDIICLGDFPCTTPVLIIAGDRGHKMFFNCPNDGYVTLWETDLNTPFKRYIFHASHDQLLRFAQVRCLVKDFLSGCDLICDQEHKDFPSPLCESSGVSS